MTDERIRITADELHGRIRDGEIDTVILAFADMQGRLVGKRVTGAFWVDHVAAHGIEACDYLLTVDMALEPIAGMGFANWAAGYGDVHVVPDEATIRIAPWTPATAIVIGDARTTDTGDPIEVSPRRILQRQLERAGELGFDVKIGCELEFYLFTESYREAARRGHRGLTAAADGILDYQLRATSDDEPVIRAIRTALEAAGVPVESSKGEAGRGQHEINLRYADAVEMADRCVLYKTIVKEVAAQHGRSATFMAKPLIDESGSSCHVHLSTWDRATGRPLMADPTTDHLDHVVGGLLSSAGDLTLLFAPYLNSYKRFATASWAPTTLAWGHDNRTCSLRAVGDGDHRRIECRVPGADVNPYVAFAGVLAGAIHGLTNAIGAGPPVTGNAYDATDAERLPSSLVEALGRFTHSPVAADAFGADVCEHLAAIGRAEWDAFHRAVTDFELRRNFEHT